jgi:hypothetical protein
VSVSTPSRSSTTASRIGLEKVAPVLWIAKRLTSLCCMVIQRSLRECDPALAQQPALQRSGMSHHGQPKYLWAWQRFEQLERRAALAWLHTDLTAHPGKPLGFCLPTTIESLQRARSTSWRHWPSAGCRSASECRSSRTPYARTPVVRRPVGAELTDRMCHATTCLRCKPRRSSRISTWLQPA